MYLDPKDFKSLKYLLDQKFDWGSFDYNILEALGLEVTENKTLSSQLLGKLAIALERLPVKTTLKEYAKAIQVAEGTLRACKSVEQRLEGLDIPDDWTFKAREVLAKQEDPQKVLKEAVEHGLSSPEFIRTFIKPKEPKIIICPHCKHELEII